MNFYNGKNIWFHSKSTNGEDRELPSEKLKVEVYEHWVWADDLYICYILFKRGRYFGTLALSMAG